VETSVVTSECACATVGTTGLEGGASASSSLFALAPMPYEGNARASSSLLHSSNDVSSDRLLAEVDWYDELCDELTEGSRRSWKE
jgi:hypothetical protein